MTMRLNGTMVPEGGNAVRINAHDALTARVAELEAANALLQSCVRHETARASELESALHSICEKEERRIENARGITAPHLYAEIARNALNARAALAKADSRTPTQEGA